MTEKRFYIDDAGELIDLTNHKFLDYGDECCKLLNELHEENMKLNMFLKAVNEELDLVRDYYTLKEENEGNIHKDCKYYNSEKDYCRNYMLGIYTGLAFEVSRHTKCIDDMKKDGDV